MVTVGDEVVSGAIRDENGSWLAAQLERRGITMRALMAVRDDVGEIAAAIRRAREDADFTFVSGGLGGTPDDVTREAVGRACDVDLVVSEELADAVRDLRDWADEAFAERAAVVPRGARVLPNPLGGAYGFALDRVFVLPGRPEELRATFEAIAGELTGPEQWTSELVYRTTEDRIGRVLDAFCVRYPGLRLGSYVPPRGAPDRVRLVLRGPDESLVGEARDWLAAEIEAALGHAK